MAHVVDMDMQFEPQKVLLVTKRLRRPVTKLPNLDDSVPDPCRALGRCWIPGDGGSETGRIPAEINPEEMLCEAKCVPWGTLYQ